MIVLLHPESTDEEVRDLTQRIRGMGLEVVSVRVGAVKPVAEVEKALQVPVREGIQQEADEATFRRRAEAVEKERAIQENELQNQIELARREADLIERRGENERKRVTDEAAAAGGEQDKIDEGEESLMYGDEELALSNVKDAIAWFKDALSKAEGSLP